MGRYGGGSASSGIMQVIAVVKRQPQLIGSPDGWSPFEEVLVIGYPAGLALALGVFVVRDRRRVTTLQRVDHALRPPDDVGDRFEA
jgi:hypothetical protein